jgi:UDP-GlcNAc:undecaprenyl-phosphate GlcNAc-1-phosphate transferase
LPNIYAHILNAFLASVLLIEIMRWLAPQLQLVDLPDARKRHDGEIPLCGGLAIFTAFMLTGIGFGPRYGIPWNMETGLGLLVLIGLADDRWRLRATTRLMAEFGAALLLVAAAGPFLLNLGTFLDVQFLLAPIVGMTLAVVFLVGTVNSINMLDGIDGLAGASTAAALFWLALIADRLGEMDLMLQALTLLAATIGFLVFNMRHPWRVRASVFLGDAGSHMLGAALAYFVIRLSTGENGMAFVTALWILVLPLTDTLSLMVRRTWAGKSALAPDRQHLHHLLVDRGLSHTVTAALLAGASTLCGAIGYLGFVAGIADSTMAIGLMIPVLLHCIVVWALSGNSARAGVRLYGQPRIPSIGDGQ